MTTVPSEYVYIQEGISHRNPLISLTMSIAMDILWHFYERHTPDNYLLHNSKIILCIK